MPTSILGIVQHQLKERRTTEISLPYDESLFEGYCHEPLTMLFEAIRINDTQKIEKSLSFVQEYGQTSGNDLLIGILAYLQIL